MLSTLAVLRGPRQSGIFWKATQSRTGHGARGATWGRSTRKGKVRFKLKQSRVPLQMAASWLCATEGRGKQGLDRGIGEARGTDAHPHKVIRSSSGMRSPGASPATWSWKKWRGRWSTSTASSYRGSRQGPNAFTRSRNTAYVIGNQGLFPKYPSSVAGFLQLDSSLA